MKHSSHDTEPAELDEDAQKLKEGYLHEYGELEEGETINEPMTPDELLSVCLQEIGQGDGGTVSSENNIEITQPLDYYYARLPGISKSKAKDKNASRYVSQDVMDGVQATIAEIMPTFDLNEIAYFRATGEDDEDMSIEETGVVNYLFMEEYDGFSVLNTGLVDCLLHRNCTAKVYWDERVDVTYETHENIPEMGLPQILAPTAENQKVEIIEQIETEAGDQAAREIVERATANPEILAQANPSADQVNNVVQLAQSKFSIRIKRMTKTGKPVIKSLPPEQIITNGDHDEPYLYRARFVTHESLQTKSDLIAQGYDPDLVDELSEYNADIENIARAREPEEQDYVSAHKSTMLIRVYESYLNVDYDGDGIAERMKVVISSNKLLSFETWDDVPLVGGVTIMAPHKYRGISMFERLKDIQDAKTPIMRSIIDGTQLSSNPRLGIVKGNANLDDILTSRTGGTVRMKTADGVVAIPNPEIPQSSYTFLEHMDTVRKDRGGGAVDIASSVQSVANNAGYSGLERILSVTDLQNLQLRNMFGETFIRGIFIQLHNLLRKHQKGPVSAKVGGRWVTSIPSDWKKRTSVKVPPGNSNGERNRKAAVMRDVVAVQDKLKSENSPMYSEQKNYTALAESVTLSGITNPERYFVDPESDEGKENKEKNKQQQNEAKILQQKAEQAMLEANNKMAEGEQLKGMAAMKGAQDKIVMEGQKNEIAYLKNQLEAMDKSGKLALEWEKLSENSALKLTEMEIKVDRDLSDQNEENKLEYDIETGDFK